MITSGRDDEEYPSPIWNPPSLCDHPKERLSFQGHFPPETPYEGVFHATCNWCGSAWNQRDNDAPWDQMMGRLMEGSFGTVSFTQQDIGDKVEWQRQTRYGDMLQDVSGSGNPIFDSNVALKPLDLD